MNIIDAMNKIDCRYRIGISFLILILGFIFTQQCRATVGYSDTISVYFRLGKATLLKEYRGNAQSLSLLDRMIANTTNRIDSISIIGSYSPEGSVAYNKQLALQRAENMSRYIVWKYPRLKTNKVPVHKGSSGNMCAALYQLVENDLQLPQRELVLKMLQKTHLTEGARMSQLRSVAPSAYQYLARHYFPVLRSAVSYIVYYNLHPSGKKPDELPVNEADSLKPVEIAPVEIVPVVIDTMMVITNETSANLQETPSVQDKYTIAPLLALKTNLLFDAASMLNIEIEVPIGQRWSVAGEWIFPWWLLKDKQHCLELLSGNIEGRYWLGDRSKKEKLTGWAVGLYVGAGYYDLEWDKTGYQGEFFLAAGLGGAFAHKIGHNLRLEYAFGVGFMRTKYRRYEAEMVNDNWHLFHEEDGRFSWFGPTRARISLVWMLNHKVKKGGSK